jgi:hypothetical protein
MQCFQKTHGACSEPVIIHRYIDTYVHQSRTQSNACARARMALALGKLTMVLCWHARFINVKPITAQEKFNFPRANAILARAQALLWVRDCMYITNMHTSLY